MSFLQVFGVILLSWPVWLVMLTVIAAQKPYTSDRMEEAVMGSFGLTILTACVAIGLWAVLS